MAEPQDEKHAGTSPAEQAGIHAATGEETPGEIREEIAQTRAEMSETIDAIQQELRPERLQREAAAMLRQEANERVDRLVSEVTRRASQAGAAAQQLSREAMTRVDAARVRVTGDTPTETGRQTRQELHTAARRLGDWVRREPLTVAAVTTVVVASVVIIVRMPRDAHDARVRQLQRRARN